VLRSLVSRFLHEGGEAVGIGCAASRRSLSPHPIDASICTRWAVCSRDNLTRFLRVIVSDCAESNPMYGLKRTWNSVAAGIKLRFSTEQEMAEASWRRRRNNVPSMCKPF
jgi:hypothetical protein